MNALPAEVLHLPTRECKPENVEWGAQILGALYHAYAATKLNSIPVFLRDKKDHVAAEIAFAKTSGTSYRRDKLSPLLSAMVVVERAGAAVYDEDFQNAAVTGILRDQILTPEQAQCDKVTLVFGGWKRSSSERCGHDRIASARLVNGLMDLHSFLISKNLCGTTGNCKVIERSVLAYLAFHYLFPTSGVYEFESDSALELRTRVIPRLLGYAHRFGLKSTDKIQVGFSATSLETLANLRLKMVTNSDNLGDYQSAVMASGLLEARLAELIVED
jgi:hypothetical protein